MNLFSEKASPKTDIYCRRALATFPADVEIPRREYDLIEFYKKVKKEALIFAVEFDIENHIVSFIGTEKPKERVEQKQ